MYKKRKLKVSYTWKNKKCMPTLSLVGAWMRELGFEIGDLVDVQMSNKQLIISKK